MQEIFHTSVKASGLPLPIWPSTSILSKAEMYIPTFRNSIAETLAWLTHQFPLVELDRFYPVSLESCLLLEYSPDVLEYLLVLEAHCPTGQPLVAFQMVSIHWGPQLPHWILVGKEYLHHGRRCLWVIQLSCVSGAIWSSFLALIFNTRTSMSSSVRTRWGKRRKKQCCWFVNKSPLTLKATPLRLVDGHVHADNNGLSKFNCIQ